MRHVANRFTAVLDAFLIRNNSHAGWWQAACEHNAEYSEFASVVTIR